MTNPDFIDEYVDSTGWSKNALRFVGYIDIMGWKSLIETENIEQLYWDLLSIVSDARVVERLFAASQEKSRPLDLLRVTAYSDSIIVYSRNNDAEAIQAILLAMSNLSSSVFRKGYSFKGAITYGPMVLDSDHQVFLGKPLVDAYLFSGELDFYGVAIHETAIQKIQQLEINPHYSEKIQDYLCHMKANERLGRQAFRQLQILVPDFVYYHEGYDNSLQDNFWQAINELELKTPASQKECYSNTVEYLRYIKDNLSR